MKKKTFFPVCAFVLVGLLFLSGIASAIEPVTVEINNALIYANPGQSVTMEFVVKNPNAAAQPTAVDELHVYLLDLPDAGLTYQNHESTKDWEHGYAVSTKDHRFTRRLFHNDRLVVTFSVNDQTPLGKYPLRAYYTYFGEAKTIGENPTAIGEPLLPLNDDVNYQFATLVVTAEPIASNPLSFNVPFSTDYLPFILVVVLFLAAIIWWFKKQKKPLKPSASKNRRG